MRRRGQTIRVTGLRRQSVDVKFFNDGSVGFRLNEAGPMLIRYAFLPGAGHNVILELTPRPGSPWAPSQGAQGSEYSLLKR